MTTGSLQWNAQKWLRSPGPDRGRSRAGEGAAQGGGCPFPMPPGSNGVDGDGALSCGEAMADRNRAATSIDGLALLDGIEPAVTHGLTMAYARADVEAPEALVERLIGQIGPVRESGRLRQAFEKQIGNAEAEA